MDNFNSEGPLLEHMQFFAYSREYVAQHETSLERNAVIQFEAVSTPTSIPQFCCRAHSSGICRFGEKKEASFTDINFHL